MWETLNVYIEKFKKARLKRRRSVSVLCALSLIVATGVFWQLHLVGISMTDEASCGKIEHEHTKECYERRLICGLEEGEIVVPPAQTPGAEAPGTGESNEPGDGTAAGDPTTPEQPIQPTEPIAPVEPNAPVEPTEPMAPAEPDNSTPETGDSTEAGNDAPEAAAPEAPAESGGELVSTETTQLSMAYLEADMTVAEEDENEDEDVQEEPPATQEPPAGVTTLPALPPATNEDQPATGGHVHTEECYEYVLICDQEEHKHSLACYANPTADVETPEDWEATLPEELSGNWAEDLVAVALSQLGYTESKANYILAEDEETMQGYTRYGAWYADESLHGAYSDWSATFVSFCLNYAGVPEEIIPHNSGAYAMMADAVENEILCGPDEWEPMPGDIVFLDEDEEGMQDGYADRVGIVTACDEYGGFTVVQGDMLMEGMEADIPVLDDSADEIIADEPSNDDVMIDNTLPEVQEPIVEEPSAGEPVIDTPAVEPEQPAVEEPTVDTPDNTEGAVAGKLASYDVAALNMNAVDNTEVHGVVESQYDISSHAIVGYVPISMMSQVMTLPMPMVDGYSEDIANQYLSDVPKANSWQVVSGEYNTGFDWTYPINPETGKEDESQPVRMRKEVMSTGTENEFYVYIEAQNKMSWSDILEGASKAIITTSNEFGGNNEQYRAKLQSGIRTESSINGNKSDLLFDPGEAANRWPDGYQTYYFTMRMHDDPNDINKVTDTVTRECYGDNPKCNNGTVYFPLPAIDATFICGPTTYQSNGEFVLDVWPTDDYGNKWEFSSVEVDLENITDTMGDYIIYEGVETLDGVLVTESENGFVWDTGIGTKREEEIAADGKTKTQWISHRILYKIRLDVEKEGFYSCAEHLDKTNAYQPIDKAAWIYETNALTHLDYTVSSGEEIEMPAVGSIEPLSPQVKGLLYDLKFKKVDDSDPAKPLAGAVFELYKANGTGTAKSIVGRVETGEDGIVEFTNLPCGTYKLKEVSSPVGYLENLDEWDIELCYTNDLKDGSITTLEQCNPDHPRNMRHKHEGSSEWEIANFKDPYYFDLTVLKQDMNETPNSLEGAEFELSPAPQGTNPIITGKDGRITVYGLKPKTTYTLTETKAPAGYQLLTAPIKFHIEKVNGDWTAIIDNPNDLEGKVSIDGGWNPSVPNEDGSNQFHGTLTITVKNETGVELPQTGGSGTLPYTMTGLLLMTVAAIYGCRQRRKQEGRAVR